MKKVIAIFLVVVFCCGFIPQHRAARQKAPLKPISELYADAIKAATIHKDTIAALGAIEAIFQQDSNYAPALNLLSKLTRVHKNAIEYSERAYLSDTTNRYYLEDYGAALVRGEEYDKAVGVFRKIVSRSTDPNHYRILAILLDSNRRTSEALAILDTAEMRFGRIPLLGRLRQYYLLKTGQTLAAEADARKAIEEAPYLAENHISLAEIYAMTRRDSLALDSFKRAIAIDTLALEPWLALAEYYQKEGNKGQYLNILERIFSNNQLPLEGKIEEWKRLVGDLSSYRRFYPQYDALIKRLYIHYPESKDVAVLYAQHLIASGDIEQALALCKRLIDYRKPLLEDFTRVIEIENHLSHIDSVRHYTDLALAAFPHNTDLLHMRGALALQRKEYDDALVLYNEALQHADNDTLRSTLWGAIGDVEHQRKEMKRCYKAYDKALRYHADNAMVLNNYAYFLALDNRNLERALTMITRALALAKNNSTYLDTMAWVLYRLGRYAEAKRYMQQALSLDRDNSAELALHYGDILHALGEEFMAKTYWRKALERGADKEEIEKRFLPQQQEKPKK
ncbi:MAG: tetratricopeptide repeat protein [Rikenellaceae bacterium]|nr:tetratricopeptide repeat protein [Rikenellaceae bacterium]